MTSRVGDKFNRRILIRLVVSYFVLRQADRSSGRVNSLLHYLNFKLFALRLKFELSKDLQINLFYLQPKNLPAGVKYRARNLNLRNTK